MTGGWQIVRLPWYRFAGMTIPGDFLMSTMPASIEVVFDAHEYSLAASEERLLRDKLDGLGRQVDQFPVAELRVNIQGVRSNQVVVRLALLLPGTTLTVEDYDVVLQPAFDRCLDSLLHELHGYKARLSRLSDAAKREERTEYDLQPSVLIDPADLDHAVREGDYAAFHRALLPLENELRLRVGRWVQRYPDIDDSIGVDLEIADIVEEVLLLAFEDYEHRPPNVPLGSWLEKLIDPAIQALVRNPGEEQENISAVRSARNAVEGQAAP